MLNLDDEKLKFKFQGKEYSVTHPSVELYEELIESLKKGEQTEAQCFFMFMEKLGVDMTLIKKMSIVQLRKLTMGFIQGK